jgi:hypothetical protein
MARKIKILGLPESRPFGEENLKVSNTLSSVPRQQANLEAEKGETAMTNLTGSGIPELYKIGGKKHYDGGTPLNLPEDSFIFSDHSSMKIKDKDVLKDFGLSPKKSGYTPAEISKKYDLNKYHKILMDPNSDELQRDTAEKMIANYNLKLGKLALMQESIKGFPQGFPKVAEPYLALTGLDENALVMGRGEQEATPESVAKLGMEVYSKLTKRKKGGELEKYQTRGAVSTTPGFGENYENELEFMKSNPSAYELYRKALESNDPNFIKAAVNTIEKQRGLKFTNNPFSTSKIFSPSIWPSSESNTFQDLQNKLMEKEHGLRLQKLDNDAKNSVVEADKTIKDLQAYLTLLPKNDLKKRIQAEQAIKQIELNKSIANKPINRLSTVTIPQEVLTILNEIPTRTTTKIGDTKDTGNTGNRQTPPSVNSNIGSSKETTNTASQTRKVKVTEVPNNKEVEEAYRSLGLTPPKKYGGSLLKAQDGKIQKEVVSENEDYALYVDGSLINKKTGKVIKGPDTKGVPTYSTSAKKFLEYIDPSSQIPMEFVPGMQRSNAGTYGSFNESNANKNWNWYGQPINWKDKTSVGNAQKAYNEEIRKRMKEAGYPEQLINETIEEIGFNELKGSPKRLDSLAGAYTGSRVIPTFKPFKKSTTESSQQVPIGEPQVQDDPLKVITHGERTTPVYNNVGFEPWWIQDFTNFAGAMGDYLTRAKFPPKKFTTDFEYADPTFYDPNRELAANTEAANMMVQNLGQFAGPQELSSRASQIAGQTAKNAADILGRYNTMNVGTANQFEMGNRQMANQANQMRTAQEKQFFDEATVFGQQDANEKRALRWNLIDMLNSGLTNAAYTANLNDMFDNYSIAPWTGGRIAMDKGRIMRARQNDPFNEKMNTVKKMVETIPGLEPKDAFELVWKLNPSSTSGMSPEMMQIMALLNR